MGNYRDDTAGVFPQRLGDAIQCQKYSCIFIFYFIFNVLQISSTFLNPGDEMCICCGDGSQFWQAGQFPAVGLSTDSGPNLRNATPYQITLCHAKRND